MVFFEEQEFFPPFLPLTFSLEPVMDGSKATLGGGASVSAHPTASPQPVTAMPTQPVAASPTGSVTTTAPSGVVTSPQSSSIASGGVSSSSTTNSGGGGGGGGSSSSSNSAVANPLHPTAAAAVQSPPAQQQPQQAIPMEIDEAARNEALAKRDAVKGLSQAELLARAAQFERIMKENEELRRVTNIYNEEKAQRAAKEKAERWNELIKIKSELIAAGYDFEKVPKAKEALDEWATDPEKAHFSVVLAVNNARASAEASKKKAEEEARLKKAQEETEYVQSYWTHAQKLSVRDVEQAKRALAQRMTAASTIKPSEPQAVKSDVVMTDGAASSAPVAQDANAAASQSTAPPPQMPLGPDPKRSLDDIALIRAQMASGAVTARPNRSAFINEPPSPAAILLDNLRSQMERQYGQPIEIAQGTDGTFATGEVINGGLMPGAITRLASELSRPRGLKDIAASALLSIRKDPRTGHHVLLHPWTGVMWDIEEDICRSNSPTDPETPPQRFNSDVLLATMSSIYRSGEGTRLPLSTWSNGSRGTLRDEDFKGYTPSYRPSLITGEKRRVPV